MTERPQPDRDPDAPSTDAVEGMPKIETPVIQIQDLEHSVDPDTRVNNSGVKIPPPASAPD